MILRSSGAWQIIIADLALILFMISLWAVSSARPVTAPEPIFGRAEPTAIYRSAAGAPSFIDWLAAQSADPRQRLTIVGHFDAAGEQATTTAALALATEARNAGYRVRTTLELAADNDVVAVLAFDGLSAVWPGGSSRSWHDSCSGTEDDAPEVIADGNTLC